MAGNGYGPSVQIARLYECTSKNGRTYFRGRLGMASVVLLKSNETGDNGAAIWSLLLQESPAKAATETSERQANRTNTQRARDGHDGGNARADRVHEAEGGDWQRRDMDDPIPF